MKRILLSLLLLAVLLLPIGDVYAQRGEIKMFDPVGSTETGTTNTSKEEYVGEEPCEDNNILKTFRLFGYLIMICKVAIPFIIVVGGILDISKAVTAGDGATLTKQGKTLGIRILIGLAIFLLPTMVYTLIENFVSSDVNSNLKCAKCLLKPMGSAGDSNCKGKYH